MKISGALASLYDTFQNKVIPWIVLLYVFLGLIVFLVTPLLFLSVVRTPFIGAFVEHTLMINTAQPTQPGSWELAGKLEQYGYQIQKIGGEPIANIQEFYNVLQTYAPGQQIQMAVTRPDGSPGVFEISLKTLPSADQFSYFAVPYITGLIYLLSGLYVFGVRRYDPAGRAFALFSTAVAISLVGIFDLYTTNRLTVIWTASLALVGGGLLNMAFLFPESTKLARKYPFLRWTGYIPSLLLMAFSIPTIYNYANPQAYVVAWRFEFVYVGLTALAFLVILASRRISSSSPVVREQARLIFLGAIVSFLPVTAWFIISPISPSIQFSSWLLLPLGIYPLLTAYALIRYRLLSTDYLLSRTVLYAFLTVLAVSGYALVVTGLVQIFGEAFSLTSPVVVGVMVFTLALGLNPVRVFFQKRIDTYFFRGQTFYQERQQAFSRDLTQALEIQDVVSLLRRYIEQDLLPSSLHIYIFDPLSGQFQATAAAGGRATSDIRFPLNCALVQTLSSGSFFIADLAVIPENLHPDRARLALVGANMFVPMPGRQQLVGWLALGLRRSGEPYHQRDVEFMTALSDQAALAIERAQVVTDLERRVHEMNILARVAQGVSFTVAFDDILELIVAQASQLLPTRDFRITLFDDEMGYYQHALYLEDDERLPEKEKLPVATNQGLELVVIETQRSLVTDDYERECRGRGQLLNATGIYAWMGVPLNAGARTVGALSLGSREPAVTFTLEQRDLFQAIADQASGAIVKARLLQESERRARQLALLNQISLDLTSTLELKPLLRQILESAISILNCQAGSLFLLDPETDELVFEVVMGPVADSLTDKRLPPGTGLVGQAVTTGRPLIANDAKRRQEWFEDTDQQTGFDTQDLLVVPMRLQDRVIGVIEVINKATGAPFTQADQDLLMAFTSQATIAIENARLYTLTDQALAARVEELSVMQRIDRELNASLEIERAMRITLDWAMRQSSAEAGLVGFIESDGLRVMTHQGYLVELAPYQPADGSSRPLIPTSLAAIALAIESGQPQCRLGSEMGDGQELGLLRNAKLHVVIPIRREAETIGILLVESAQTESCSTEVISFLTRLSDHAAIAISNARLFEEVREANLAKSRFVSFVAHELKNPMASIKGYTELVAKGMAGPVNDMQASFLETVRANVDRMNTIVSDLNDLTKIQVGSLRLDYHSVKVGEVLDEVIRSLKRQIEEKEQRLTLALPDDLAQVWVDPARLAQILTNLLSNAHKYAPTGSDFTVGAEVLRPTEESLPGIQYIHIWVEDHGIGISEDDQQKIFQQYFRTEAAKEMASGTGLGLSITKSLVEMQGGRIWFESLPGAGTTFHFTIPVAETQ